LKLASQLDTNAPYASLLLREMLVLFIDQSAPVRHGAHKDGHIRDKIERVSHAERASVLPHLLDTLSIIESILSLSSLRIQKESANEELVVLFRNLWFISTVLGLTFDKTKDAQHHRAFLKSIAFKTPCLLQYTQSKYVETELEYNPFIRKEHGQVSEFFCAEMAGDLTMPLLASLPKLCGMSWKALFTNTNQLQPVVSPTHKLSSSLRWLSSRACVQSLATPL
jgi:hypothetical protein